MKKIIIILLYLSFVFSGCNFLYVNPPTKISYSISIGYLINCSGFGKHSISYICGLPEVLSGKVSNIKSLHGNYEKVTFATNNPVYVWNFTKNNSNNYKLGISADILAQSYIYSDISGKKCLKIQEINDKHKTIVKNYCKKLSNDSYTFIAPDDPNIKSTALKILKKAKTNNSLLVAKKLFIWLKKNINYKLTKDFKTQEASVTYKKKAGDCDDLSFLYISLCRSIKIPARFIRGFLVEKNKVNPHSWVEIYVGCDENNGWIPVECSGISNIPQQEVNINFGVEKASHLRLFIDDGTNKSIDLIFSSLSYSTTQNVSIKPVIYLKIKNYKILEEKKLGIKKNIRFYKRSDN